MCQTTVICEYLGQQFGLYPDTDTNVWRARQINQTIHDFQNEGDIFSYSYRRSFTKVHTSVLGPIFSDDIFIILMPTYQIKIDIIRNNLL